MPQDHGAAKNVTEAEGWPTVLREERLVFLLMLGRGSCVANISSIIGGEEP